jgi:hypothetical protein
MEGDDGVWESRFGRLITATAVLALALPATAPAQLTERSYIGADSGLWDTAANWSGSDRPDSVTELAELANGTAETPITVRINASRAIGGFRQGPNNTLTRDSTTTRGLTLSAGDSTVFTNEGVIASGSAAATSGTLSFTFTNGTYRNSGTFRATAGTTLSVTKQSSATSYTLDNSGAQMVAESGGTLSLTSGAVSGGRVETAEGGLLSLSLAKFLNGCATTVANGSMLNGTATFEGSALTNNGLVRVGGSSSGNSSRLELTNSVMLNAGTATVYIKDNSSGGADAIQVKAESTLHNTGMLIVTNERVTVSGVSGLGRASIDVVGNLVNDGTIHLTGPNGYASGGVTTATGSTQIRPTGGGAVWLTGNGTVYITPRLFDTNTRLEDGIRSIYVPNGGAILNIGTNQTIIARGSGPSFIDGPGYQSLALRVNNYGTIVADGALGGPLNISPGGGYFNQYGTLTATNAGRLNLTGSTLTFSNFGTIRVPAGCTLSNELTFAQSGGTSRVDGVWTSPTKAFDATGGTLTGVGLMETAVTLSGAATVAPGDPVGTLTVTNKVVTLTNGRMAITLDAVDAFSQLRATGAGAGLTLSGTNDVLDVSAPIGGWQGTATFRVFEGGTRTGTFDTLLWAGTPVTDQYTVSYGADYVDIDAKAPASPGTLVVVR